MPTQPHCTLRAKNDKSGRIQHRLILMLLPWAVGLATALPSWAATQLVTNTNDSGSGSLRAAVTSAASGDTVQFSVPNPSTIVLASPITINTSLTITGPGATQLAISGNYAVKVFVVNQGLTVAISGLTIENGNANNDPNYVGGGGIYNLGTLTLSNCILSGNSALSGGAIASGVSDGNNDAYNIGSLTITSCTISGNSSAGYGGGITSFSALAISNSTVANNYSGQAGGGIYVATGTSTLIDSTVSGNSTGGSGGGIVNSSLLVVTNSTLSGNSATYGGAISSNLDPAFNTIDTVTVTSSTISANSATYGSGVYNDVDSTFLIKSVLLVGNTGGGNCSLLGPTTSDGYNLSDDNTCAASFTATGDQNNVAAGLDPKGLQNNGGPTQTIALLSSSPAVDAIPVASCTDTQGNRVTTDQRGIARPQSPGCDIGAFELVETIPFTTFSAQLELLKGKLSGFNLTANFTLEAGQSLTPLTEAVTLTVGSYSVTLLAGSFHQVRLGPVTDYVYLGTINKVLLDVQIVPLGGNCYAFQAAGTPVALTGTTSSVPVTLTIGQGTGSTTVTPVVLRK